MFSLAGLLGGPTGGVGRESRTCLEDQLLGTGFACAFYFDDTILDSSLVLTSVARASRDRRGRGPFLLLF